MTFGRRFRVQLRVLPKEDRHTPCWNRTKAVPWPGLHARFRRSPRLLGTSETSSESHRVRSVRSVGAAHRLPNYRRTLTIQSKTQTLLLGDRNRSFGQRLLRRRHYFLRPKASRLGNCHLADLLPTHSLPLRSGSLHQRVCTTPRSL